MRPATHLSPVKLIEQTVNYEEESTLKVDKHSSRLQTTKEP